MIPRFSTRTLFLATIVIAVLSTIYVWFRPGVTVSIHNTGSMEMKGLVVEVTGRSYNPGEVPAGVTKSCVVIPKGDSHVEIAYTLDDGQQRHSHVGCYFEPRYRGRIYAEVKNGEVVRETYRFSY